MSSAPILTFHIIYVPGSVEHLLPFVPGLLRWSDCRFRLVANNCTPMEVEMLHTFADRQRRVEALVLPTNRPLTHHDALNYLQARCQEEHFCFMDSDILAAGPFMADIAVDLAAHSAIFAGSPLWMRPCDRLFHPHYDVVCGEHDQTSARLPLGGTFFAIYDNRVLSDFIRQSGMGFEMRGFSQLPPPLQAWCAEHGLAGPRHYYDTAKSLNLGLLQAGHTLAVRDSPQLYHLGGLSFIAKRAWYDRQKGLSGRWGAFYRTARSAYIGLRRRMKNDPVNRSRKLPFGRRRRVYGPYFTALLTALADGRKPPPLPAEDDAGVRRRAQAATEQILAATRAWAAQNGRETGQ